MSAATKFAPVSTAPASGDSNGIMLVVKGGKIRSYNNGEKSESELANGTAYEGTYLGSVPNKFEPTKSDYQIRMDDDTLVILGNCASLNQQLTQVAEGELVRVSYNGRKTIKRKTGATAEMHDFLVERAIES